MKKLTAEQKRKARNEYSRKWKLAHKKDVQRWNREWAASQKKGKSKQKAKKAAKKLVVRKPKAVPTFVAGQGPVAVNKVA